MKAISEIKSDIVEALYNFSAYDLPSVCESIGLASGTTKDAFSSKRRYVSERLRDFDKKTIFVVIKSLKDKLGIDLYPIKNYTYKLSNVTKRDIIDVLMHGVETTNFFGTETTKITWHGVFDEWDFVESVCDVNKITPLEGYETFKYEYIRHRINNDDFDNDWFFKDKRFPFQSGTDKDILTIICKIFHPEIRNEKENWMLVLNQINDLISFDGFEIYKSGQMSGRDIFNYRKLSCSLSLSGDYSEEIKNKLSSEYVNAQVQFMIDNVEENPYIAIGKAKELLETILKTILQEQDISVTKDVKLTALDKEVRKLLNLSAEDNSSTIPGVKQILGGLSSITMGLSELRNAFGDGHGRQASFKSLPPRYAKLAVGSVNTYVLFLLETYEMFIDKIKN